MIHSPFFAFLSPAPGQAGGGLMIVVIQITALIAIFYFLLIRPQRQQQQKHQEMLNQLKKGDEIVTSGGIVGRVVHIKEDRVTIESAESRLVIERDKVAKVMVPQAAAEKETVAK